MSSGPRRRQHRVRRVLLAANVGAVVALLLIGGWDWLQLRTGIGLPTRTAPAMLLVAHRGDLEHFPENTAEAILAAAELGVDGIEFDVQLSADGTWWVLHDPTLGETTTGSGRIADLPDHVIESARIDGGFGYDPERHRDLRVPRLTDLLADLSGYDGILYVDLQHAISGDAGALAALLGNHRAAVLCRNLEDARAVKRMNPALQTLVRFESQPEDPVLDGWLAEAVHEATLDRVHRAGLPVTTYIDEWRFGEDEAPVIRRAWAAGVEAFLTKRLGAAMTTVAALEDGAAP